MRPAPDAALPARLKELRLSLGLGQPAFGERLGVTKQCVSNWENGNVLPSVDMLARVAERFGASADWLLGLDGRDTVDITALPEEAKGAVRTIVRLAGRQEQGQTEEVG